MAATMARAFSPASPPTAEMVTRPLSSMLIYFLMALVLIVRPTGLFPGNAK